MAKSSSGTKPCAHQTSAVVAAALARYGLTNVPTAAAANEVRSTERLLRFPMSAFLPVHAARFARGLVCERRLRPSAPAVNGFFIRMKIVSLRSLGCTVLQEGGGFADRGANESGKGAGR